MLPKEIHIKLSARFDGGVRVSCEEMPGLILDGSNPEKVVAAIWPALEALGAYRLAHPRFVEGDRVRHIGRGEDGAVLSNVDGVVRVQFDKPAPSGNASIGEFDEVWFNTHPKWLLKLGTGSESATGLAQYDTPSPAREQSEGPSLPNGAQHGATK